MQEPARIAIDLGAESCRVSLLRWNSDRPTIEVIHRIPNGPVHSGQSLHWPLDTILAGLEEGLRKAAAIATEGVASIAVDSWGVDYVRLTPDGAPLRDPFCYRDERTVATKDRADSLIPPLDLYRRTGVLPHRINTVCQLMADPGSGIDPHAPWVIMPESVLHWLGARRVAEYTHATHTGLVNLAHRRLGPRALPSARSLHRRRTAHRPHRHHRRPAPRPARRSPRLPRTPAHRTRLSRHRIRHRRHRHPASTPPSTSPPAPGRSSERSSAVPVTTPAAFDAGYTNLGAATGDLLFHSLVNSMWVLKQCMDSWAAEGRPWEIEDLIEKAAD